MASPERMLLNGFLFSIRESLMSIKAACEIGEQQPKLIPTDVLNWCRKWETTIDAWILAESEAHSYFQDGKAHDWEQIALDLAENMKTVSNAYTEARALSAKSDAGKCVLELALPSVEGLHDAVHAVLAKDYQRFLG